VHEEDERKKNAGENIASAKLRESTEKERTAKWATDVRRKKEGKKKLGLHDPKPTRTEERLNQIAIC